MRENEDMLRQFDVLIKRAEIGGGVSEENMQLLRNFVDK
jgi:hypothetical protein